MRTSLPAHTTMVNQCLCVSRGSYSLLVGMCRCQCFTIWERDSDGCVVRGDIFRHVCRSRGHGSCSQRILPGLCMRLMRTCVFPQMLHKTVLFQHSHASWCSDREPPCQTTMMNRNPSSFSFVPCISGRVYNQKDVVKAFLDPARERHFA